MGEKITHLNEGCAPVAARSGYTGPSFSKARSFTKVRFTVSALVASLIGYSFFGALGCGLNQPAVDPPVGQSVDDSVFQGPIEDEFNEFEPGEIIEAPIEEPIRAEEPPIAADFNSDGVLDSEDEAAFQSQFGNVDGDEDFNPVADLDGDGVISLVDFQMFLNLMNAG